MSTAKPIKLHPETSETITALLKVHEKVQGFCHGNGVIACLTCENFADGCCDGAGFADIYKKLGKPLIAWSEIK